MSRKKQVIVMVDGEPRSACCKGALDVRREVGPDTAIYEAVEYYPPEGKNAAELKVRFVKTYDAVDNGDYEVHCGTCGAGIEIEVEEG